LHFAVFRTLVGGLPAEGFEPPTYGLQNRCTTTVLSRHIYKKSIQINLLAEITFLGLVAGNNWVTKSFDFRQNDPPR
jgi:hypothetical protein